VGFASVSGSGVTTTTGGGTAAPTTVTTLSQLNSAAAGATAKVIWVQGTISGNVTVGSNKTIIGVCGGQVHGNISMIGSVNVIVRNLTIVGYGAGNCALDPSYDPSVGCSSGADAVTIQKSAHHIWIDHCDISDGTDGNLDITDAADFLTVSWTKFHYTARTDPTGSDSTGASGHRFSCLIGASDNDTSDTGKLNITWHHDWWADNVAERQPRVRFGKNHLFNNLWSSSGDGYCVRAGIGAQLLLEGNSFTSVKNPHEFNSSSDQATAFITAGSSNIYSSVTGTRATGGGGTPFTTPGYSYTVDAVGTVQATVMGGAGPQ
jgi:pectate lyase